MSPETTTDGYKVDHRRQYVDGTELIVSNYTPRGTRRDGVEKIVFFGLQYLVKKYLIQEWNENFFNVDEETVVRRFYRRIKGYLGEDAAKAIGVEHIRDLHKLGYLPIKILALPEGTECNLRVPSLVIYNTKPEFFWITNYLETLLSVTLWGPCTSATTAFQYRKLFEQYAKETVGNTDFVQWQGHDFSFRGMFGLEAACMSGGAHLAVGFTGTDTIPAIDWLEDYYNADSDKELVAASVPATEHSVACSTILNFVEKVRVENAGRPNQFVIEDELMDLADIEYVRHLITDLYPKGIVSIVSDSFDYWNTIINTARILKNEIMGRDGKVVFRPDTGDPVKVVCGYNKIHSPEFFTGEEREIEIARNLGRDAVVYNQNVCEIGSVFEKAGCKLSGAEIKGSIECLWDIFGGTITEKGYKLLDSHVGLIYGDSITLQRAKDICSQLKNKGFASINLVYGIGSYTYQYVTRDTDGNAVKSTYSVVDGKPIPIYKKPKTGDGLKNSAFGLTAVYKDGNNFVLKDGVTWEEMHNCELKPVFENGQLLKNWTLQEIRENLSKP